MACRVNEACGTEEIVQEIRNYGPSTRNNVASLNSATCVAKAPIAASKLIPELLYV